MQVAQKSQARLPSNIETKPLKLNQYIVKTLQYFFFQTLPGEKKNYRAINNICWC